MPKLFSISLDVEEIALGSVIHALHTMPGIARVHLDLDATKNKPVNHHKANGADRPRASKGKPRKTYDTSSADFALSVLYKKSPMRTGEIRQAFADDGRGDSMASAIYNLRKAGDVDITPEGYVLTKKARDRLRHRLQK